jgi:hypothetical protein
MDENRLEPLVEVGIRKSLFHIHPLLQEAFNMNKTAIPLTIVLLAFLSHRGVFL